METPQHRIVGVATALGVAHIHSLPVAGVSVTVASAAVFAGGWLSPDVDNQPWWKSLDHWVPDEWLGGGGPLAHRALLHSWLIPVVMWVLALHVSGIGGWVLLGAAYGWASHVVADGIFGHGGFGHGKGVPLVLWFCHVGGWFKADGWPEKAAGALAAVVALWFAVSLAVPLPAIPHPWSV